MRANEHVMDALRPTNLVVLASTFPRWADDSVPRFVLDYVRGILPYVGSVTVVAPHYKGAKRKETLPGNIAVRRFRYAYPYKYENIAYGQFKKTKFYPLKVLLYALSESWTTLLVCLRNRPAIINAHWIIPQGFVAVVVGKLLGIKIVVSVHGADVYTLNGKVMRTVKRFVLRHADAVIANSSATQSECIKLWPERDYPIIPMGVNTDVFRPVPGLARQNENFTCLFVGRLAPSKGVVYLCEAFAMLHANHPDARLVIVGEGPERPVLEQFVAERNLADAVRFVGWAQHGELAAYYQQADVFVGPSVESEAGRKEALGVVFAEALAAGMPVITTDAGGMTDIVQDGVSGWIVPQKDPRAIYNALAKLYARPEKGRQMGERGSAFVRANFSWESVVRRYLALFKTLVL